MTEWLNENAGRAYPLARQWPDETAAIWTPVLLDACVGFDGLPSEGIVALGSVTRNGDSATLRFGTSSDAFADVTVSPGTGDHSTAYSAGHRVRAFVTVGNRALASAIDGTPDGRTVDVGVPLALRCASYSNRRVTSVAAYAPEDPCSRPLYSRDSAVPTKSASGDVVLVSLDGIDVDVTQLNSEDLVRITAVTAPSASPEAVRPVDMTVRGDECIQVDAIPGVDENMDPDPDKGVIRIVEKCRPCCQCEDYADAVSTLSPGNRKAHDIETALGKVREEYETAVKALAEIKREGLARVNGYGNVVVSAVAVASGGVTPKAMSAGSRQRIAVTLTAANMTMENAVLSEASFEVGDGYSQSSVRWMTAGSVKMAGSSLGGVTWRLAPGDSLTVVAEYAREARTNSAAKPTGMKALLTGKLPSHEEAHRYEEDVK